MRGVTSIAVAAMLLGLAWWTFLQKGIGTAPVVLGVAAFVMFVRGSQGFGLNAAVDDAAGAADFISNPSGAIVDSAFDTLGGMLKDRQDEGAGTKPAFDPDAAIARYLENRPEPLPASADPMPARPQFGRKGL